MVLIRCSKGFQKERGYLYFRPLAGIMVLILCTFHDTDFPTNNFRPLAGIMVLISGQLLYIRKTSIRYFRPLAGIMVLIHFVHLINKHFFQFFISVPLRGLWFLSAPFINAFMKPSKWHFAGRIIYFHHFLSFAGKWFSKNCLELNFKAAGRNRPACIFKKQVRHINNVLPSQFIL